MDIYQGSAGKTAYLQTLWHQHSHPEQVLVWVESWQAVNHWQTWHRQQAPDRVLVIGTLRAWPRRWVQTYWQHLQQARAGLTQKLEPDLPSVLGAQWWMDRVLNQFPTTVQKFEEAGWSRRRLACQLVQWGITWAEGDPVLPWLSMPLAEEIEGLLIAYREASWQAGILDYGQQLQVLKTYLLTDTTWLAGLAQKFPTWLCDDLQEWPPTVLTVLEAFTSRVTLNATYNPHLAYSPSLQIQIQTQHRLQAYLDEPITLLTESLDQLTQVLPPGTRRLRVATQALLWPQSIQEIEQIVPQLSAGVVPADIVLLIPRADPVIYAQLHHYFALANLKFNWFFPEQDLAASPPGQWLKTVLKWLDSTTWGLPTIYETTHLLEFGFGLSSGQALKWARQMHQPFGEAETAPLVCQKFVVWLEQARSLGASKCWTSIFEDLLLKTVANPADLARLAQLDNLGQQLLRLGTFSDVRLLWEVEVLPRWELPLDPSAITVTSPSRWVASRRSSQYQIWLDINAEAWNFSSATNNLRANPLLAYAYTCLQRNRSGVSLIASCVDREGQPQTSLLSPWLAGLIG